MSTVMDVNAIMEIEADHYEAGKYRFNVRKADIIETKNGRPGINLQLVIEDADVLKGDRVPKGEMMFKRLYFPVATDKPTSSQFMGRLIQEFLKATGIQNHPDYATVLNEGLTSEAFWNLALGSIVDAKVTWKEGREKTTDDNGKVTYVGTGEMEQDITNFRPLKA